ncbi:hypothetical protein [Pseudoalteromonas piscicida]|uniref:hypothetical protein n=1 Tax=Pseudoalteromonas piscicida TaxID=43662 RepID=UPI0032C114C3
MFKRKVCNWLMVLSTVLVTNLSYSQEMTPELFFAKKKLQKAAISYTAAMETCFEYAPRVKPSQLKVGKFETEFGVKAINYLHYVALNDCMQDHDVNFLKAVEHYNQTAQKHESISVDSFVTYRWNEELRSEFEFQKLPTDMQAHFLQLEVLQKPFNAAKLVMELLGEL